MRYTLRHVLTLTALTAVWIAVTHASSGDATVTVTVTAAALACVFVGFAFRHFCGLGTHGTAMATFAALDLAGATAAGTKWFAMSMDPAAYPDSISLGGPTSAFILAAIALTPLAVLGAITAVGGLCVLDHYYDPEACGVPRRRLG